MSNNSPFHTRISWRNPIQSDVDLVLHSKTYKVHMLFFSMGRGRSDYLYTKMMADGPLSDDNKTIVFTDLLPESATAAFESMLDYAYGHEIVIDDMNALSLLKIAKRFQMKALHDESIDYIKSSIKEQEYELYKAEPSQWEWDVTKKAPTVDIDADNRCVATKVFGGTAWNAAVIAKCSVPNLKSASRFTVKVKSLADAKNLMIGFVDGALYNPDGNNYNSSGYFLNCWEGVLYSLKDSNRVYLNQNIDEGAVVEGRYDSHAGTISFSVGRDGNMKDCGVAFVNVSPEGGLWPCVDFANGNDSVELLDAAYNFNHKEES